MYLMPTFSYQPAAGSRMSAVAARLVHAEVHVDDQPRLREQASRARGCPCGVWRSTLPQKDDDHLGRRGAGRRSHREVLLRERLARDRAPRPPAATGRRAPPRARELAESAVHGVEQRARHVHRLELARAPPRGRGRRARRSRPGSGGRGRPASRRAPSRRGATKAPERQPPPARPRLPVSEASRIWRALDQVRVEVLAHPPLREDQRRARLGEVAREAADRRGETPVIAAAGSGSERGEASRAAREDRAHRARSRRRRAGPRPCLERAGRTPAGERRASARRCPSSPGARRGAVRRLVPDREALVAATRRPGPTRAGSGRCRRARRNGRSVCSRR